MTLHQARPNALQQTTPQTGEPVALITGASSGIGAAVALQLAARRINLVLHGRSDTGESSERLASVEAQCLQHGASSCVRITAELGNEAAAQHLIDAAQQRYGRLDLLVANAGYARSAGIASSSWASMLEALSVMPLTFAAMLRHAAPLLGASPCARVVAVSSFVAHRFDHLAPFVETAAAKAALEAVALSAAAEFAARGITVNCVAPGFTRKDRPSSHQAAWLTAAEVTPLGHVATAKQIAASICFLLSPEAGHITGTVLHVDGGLTLL